MTDNHKSIQKFELKGVVYRTCLPYPSDPAQYPLQLERVEGNWPDLWMCPWVGGPPLFPVYMNIRDKDGNLSAQVFEHSRLFKAIATPGENVQTRLFRHPMMEAFMKQLP